MSIQVKAKTSAFKDATWEKSPADPGEAVELKVTGERLGDSDEVWFVVWKKGAREAGPLAAIKADKDGTAYKKKWALPNTYADVELEFDAQVRVKPAPENGHRTIVHSLTSGALVVQGYQVTITSLDAAFVPKRDDEKLELKHAITDPHGAAKKGRYEIWAERYPGASATDPPQPLYTKDFTPAAGATTWHEWKGLANAGVLDGKYLTPEFSPYRLRVVIGPDQGSVEDPYGVGAGKVAMAEKQFEVRIESLRIRLQQGLGPAEKAAFDTMLAVEPRTASGAYLARGRLPLERPDTKAVEVGRVRLKCQRHTRDGESLSQGHSGGQHHVADSYMDANEAPMPVGPGATKHAVENTLYTRPEIPVEIEPRLKSRDSAKNGHPHFGVFEADAVGELKLDAFVEDVHVAAHLGTGADKTYLTQATTRTKRGTHAAPFKGFGAPFFENWQKRFVATDGQREFDCDPLSATNVDELVVYVNRTRLKKTTEYTYATRKVKLAEGIARAKDVVWVIRTHASRPVAGWHSIPPGDNCHAHYGGLRGSAKVAGESRSRLLRDSFAGGATYPYTAAIKLDPDDVAGAAERVETRALATGAEKGLAGVIFSPSVIGGDSYVLDMTAAPCPYDRSLGFVCSRDKPEAAGAAEPYARGRSGRLEVWRLCTLEVSLKLPPTWLAGLGGGVGQDDFDMADGGNRPHPGTGEGMALHRLNELMELGFCEWTCPEPVAITAATRTTPLVVTAAGHGLQTGQVVTIAGVRGNTAANGTHVVRVKSADSFELCSAYDFTAGDGLGAAVTGNAAFQRITISAASNTAPITVTAAGHGLSDGAFIKIIGVGGNLAANGLFQVDRVDDNTLRLRSSDGTESGTFSGNGYGYTGFIDVHRGVNLIQYRDTHMAATPDTVDVSLVFGDGLVPIDDPDKVTNAFVQWDYYRVLLPPVPDWIENERHNVMVNAIAALPRGSTGDQANAALGTALTDWNNEINTGTGLPYGPTRADAVLGGSDIAPTAGAVTESEYKNWVKGVVRQVAHDHLDAQTPAQVPPRIMKTIRWPKYFDDIWTGSGTSGVGTAGFCRGSAQSFFATVGGNPDTFEHEMGHSLFLCHFCTGSDTNTCWKHHDHGYPSCIMGYYDQPNGTTYDVDTTTNPAVQLNTGTRDRFCAKCLLKVRGWKEDVLPCNWSHPEIF